MLTPLEKFYLDQPEPDQGCLLALKEVILKFDPLITEEWKYRLPFFYLNGQMFCYLWRHKKFKCPYVGIVRSAGLDFPELIQEKRVKMKIMLINPMEDLQVQTIYTILNAARQYH